MAYVEHPRYGNKPRYTGVDPDLNSDEVNLHYNTGLFSDSVKAYLKEELDWRHESEQKPILGTAIEADLTQQTPATMGVTHYYDIERSCRDCGKLFLFFAEEQKYWYEELKFSLDADCIRCVPCRKDDQYLTRLKARYDELAGCELIYEPHLHEIAEIRLELLEAGVFPVKHAEKVRQFFNRCPNHPSVADFKLRLQAVEGSR